MSVPESTPLGPYLTVEEVAAALQVKPKTVYGWALADSSMPTLRVGHTIRFPQARLERWLREREQGRPRINNQVRAVRAVDKSAPPQEATGA